MHLKAHYDGLYSNTLHALENDIYSTDNLISDKKDFRRGITLRIRPPECVNLRIQTFLDDLKAVDPNQYYYPDSDIHITVMSVISCYSGFRLKTIVLQDYIHLIQECLQQIQEFSIAFKGVTGSLSCIMIQGFPTSEGLNQLRDALRHKFKNSSLQQSLDSRYTIQTAHATVVRFKSELQQKAEFINCLNQYREFDFGTFNVNEVELVYNDWYQKAEHVKLLHTFSL
ncbi:2'-5' RNA ligase family protein [Formosa sp. S-31]|uniref:2'-5' RNA ligase family protein n=1 Tax=Formosa sp. S-31 TaxID=2790949 RepID=UPI003EBDB2EF